MASSRKKQDEKHLKILRNLVSLPGNKQCFDCNQKGPTYVNITIGSFVCTTCSGLLRGLTPPHRVKSISMATFTAEEVDSLQNKGNEYCRKVWLALHDSNNIQNAQDEHLVRDFMVAKYEKKLYYMEPVEVTRNGNSSLSGQSMSGTVVENSKSKHIVPNSSLIISQSSAASQEPKSKNSMSLSITSFGPRTLNIRPSNSFGIIQNDLSRHKKQINEKQSQQETQEYSFANFDNNPIFNSISTVSLSSSLPTLKNNTISEDKYAALKDLDCLMKMQQESPQSQGTSGNGWLQNNFEKSPSSNPFQTDVGNNNVVNPFRTGFIHQVNSDANNTISSFNNNGSSNGSSNNSHNPWAPNNLWNDNPLPGNQQLSFPPNLWNVTGNLNVIPGNSNNPFL